MSGNYIEDQSLMPRYGSRALGGKGHEGQNLSTFVWVLIHPWRWLAWASVIEKSLLRPCQVATEQLSPPTEHHPFGRSPPLANPLPSVRLRYIIYIGRAEAEAWLCSPASETIINGL